MQFINKRHLDIPTKKLSMALFGLSLILLFGSLIGGTESTRPRSALQHPTRASAWKARDRIASAARLKTTLRRLMPGVNHSSRHR